MPESMLIKSHERCWLIQTTGQWPWKSESAKECVTTHLQNQLALKMDGTQVSYPHLAVGSRGLTQRVGGRKGGRAAYGTSLGEAAPGADLDGSSKYSNKNFED